MQQSNNIRLIWDVLTKPLSFFKKFADNLPDLRKFIVSYGAPLVVLAAAGRMTRIMQAFAFQDEPLRSDQLSGIFIISFVGYSLSVWLGALFIARLSKAFQSESSQDKSMLLIILAYTPFMLAQPLAAITPNMAPILILGILYTVFLFGAGARPILGTPKQKIVGFTLVGYFIVFSISHLSILLLSELFIFAR